MLTSTPKKAVSSEASLIQCFICAESLETAVFGRSQCDLRGTFSKILGGKLQSTCKLKDRSMFAKRSVFHG